MNIPALLEDQAAKEVIVEAVCVERDQEHEEGQAFYEVGDGIRERKDSVNDHFVKNNALESRTVVASIEQVNCEAEYFLPDEEVIVSRHFDQAINSLKILILAVLDLSKCPLIKHVEPGLEDLSTFAETIGLATHTIDFEQALHHPILKLRPTIPLLIHISLRFFKLELGSFIIKTSLPAILQIVLSVAHSTNSFRITKADDHDCSQKDSRIRLFHHLIIKYLLIKVFLSYLG